MVASQRFLRKPPECSLTLVRTCPAMVTQIFAQNKKQHEAVFYTHGHGDHVGLLEYIPEDVPQYMSEGTNGLLKIKNDVLYKGAGIKVNEILENECDSQEYSDAMNRLLYAENKCKLLNKILVWKRTPPRKAPQSICIGDIKVTPFFNCHSIYDSHMFQMYTFHQTDGNGPCL